VGYCESAQKIDTPFCNMFVIEDDSFLLNDAIDYININGKTVFIQIYPLLSDYNVVHGLCF